MAKWHLRNAWAGSIGWEAISFNRGEVWFLFVCEAVQISGD